jgi:MerR family transcriptional regulator, thiopeptide resistance regulator
VTASRPYRVREFARLTGTTEKALRHYERLGLLTPARSAAGHRLYTARERERLRQILALKRLGVPLGRMRGLLDANPAAFLAYLRARRTELANQQDRLRQDDRAMALVEESLRRAPTDHTGAARLADVLEVDQLSRYFDADVWDVARRFYTDWPSEGWIPLFREAAAAIADGPDSVRAEDLLRRWNEVGRFVWRDMATDPRMSNRLREGFARAWRDREHWPTSLQRRFADYRMDEVAAFLGKVSITVPTRRGPQWFAPKYAGSATASSPRARPTFERRS